MRLVLISDTHTHHSELAVPDGDILIHAGDYGLARSRAGRLKEKASFEEWLGRLPHEHKVFVQGNHDEGQPGSDEARVAHTSTLTDELVWTADGEAELKKIPFFVRGKVRRNTEAFAKSTGRNQIDSETLYDAKAHFSA